ncbi:sigma-70 family RNA polymerase sigma factor [Solicola sp. PLA-1-18]|uniref:sigma-70 family RNA polymerase sigma factor n=1 Tax=Solicola sp. PLA-1-18 TaxID=3380532 RepID=UPI003B7FFD16
MLNDLSPGAVRGTAHAHPADHDLVSSHLALVGHLVREVHGRVPRHVDRDDLTGAGYEALVLAARAWDAQRGVSFARYASVRIRGALLDQLRGLDWASRSVRRRARDIDHTRSRLAVELGRNPSDTELSQATGLSIAGLSSQAADLARSVVLSTQAFDDEQLDGLVSRHAVDPLAVVENREKMAYLADAVATLPDRLRAVVEGTFFHDRTLVDLAGELGVSESRVCQLRVEALGLLKEAMNHALEPDLVATTERPHGCAARRRDAYFAEVAAHRTFRERLSPTPTRTDVA